MTFSDIVNQLHNEHRFTDTSTAEQTDFATFALGFEQVDDLDARSKDFGSDCQVVKFGSRLMD